MPFVSVTRLRLRSAKFVPFLLWNNWRSSRQVARSAGFLGGQLLVDCRLTFWTMTVWKNLESMRSFRNDDAHKDAMPKLAHWCDESSAVHWEQGQPSVPHWLEAHKRMVREGRESPVEMRSSSFDLQKIPTPRFSAPFVQILRPSNRANASSSHETTDAF